MHFDDTNPRLLDFSAQVVTNEGGQFSHREAAESFELPSYRQDPEPIDFGLFLKPEDLGTEFSPFLDGPFKLQGEAETAVRPASPAKRKHVAEEESLAGEHLFSLGAKRIR